MYNIIHIPFAKVSFQRSIHLQVQPSMELLDADDVIGSDVRLLPKLLDGFLEFLAFFGGLFAGFVVFGGVGYVIYQLIQPRTAVVYHKRIFQHWIDERTTTPYLRSRVHDGRKNMH
ncbi:Uncharacterised protein r2_g2099 [Pycnogonum litorale]